VPVNDPTNPAYDPTVPVPDSSRRGAKARYAFANFSAQRLLNLGHGWDLLSRATLQLSEANLLSSEQLTIGGTSTVRGFNESIFAGDNGFVFNNEFLTPSWKKNLPWISKIRGPVESRGLLFFDMAKVSVRHPYNEPPRAPLAGAGVGLRMNLANNFSLTADYGWQISHMPAAYHLERGSRAHLRVMLAF
jgi:hemolysin activation/secretion protein